MDKYTHPSILCQITNPSIHPVNKNKNDTTGRTHESLPSSRCYSSFTCIQNIQCPSTAHLPRKTSHMIPWTQNETTVDFSPHVHPLSSRGLDTSVGQTAWFCMCFFDSWDGKRDGGGEGRGEMGKRGWEKRGFVDGKFLVSESSKTRKRLMLFLSSRWDK